MHQETIPLLHAASSAHARLFFVILNEWFYTHEWKHSSGRSLFWNPALSWFEYNFVALSLSHTLYHECSFIQGEGKSVFASQAVR
jgi:hypothetical protein